MSDDRQDRAVTGDFDEVTLIHPTAVVSEVGEGKQRRGREVVIIDVGGGRQRIRIDRGRAVSSLSVNSTVSPATGPASGLPVPLSLPAAWRVVHRLPVDPVVGEPTQHGRVEGGQRGGGKLTQTLS